MDRGSRCCTGGSDKNHLKEKEMQEEWLSQEALQVAAAAALQSCQTLCDSIDGSPPGSPVPGILQARTLKWVAISFSKA